MLCYSIYLWFLKSPITFFVSMVVSDGDLETNEKNSNKGNKLNRAQYLLSRSRYSFKIMVYLFSARVNVVD